MRFTRHKRQQNPQTKPKIQTIQRITNPTSRSMRASCATNVTENPQTKQNPKPFLTKNPITKPTSRFAHHKRDKNPNQTKIKNVDVLTVPCVPFICATLFFSEELGSTQKVDPRTFCFPRSKGAATHAYTTHRRQEHTFNAPRIVSRSDSDGCNPACSTACPCARHPHAHARVDKCVRACARVCT